MAVDMFLKIMGVDGESQDSKHANEIEVLSFSWGVTNQSRRAGTSRIGSTGKPTISDLSIVKRLDSASPRLFEVSCTGEHLHDAVLTMRKAGDKPVEFYKVTMSDVLISSVQPAGSAGDLGFEQVSFSFANAMIEAAKVDAKGSTQWVKATTCGASTAPDLLVDGPALKR